MEFITDYQVEDYILNTGWADLPTEVQQRAALCALDLITALLLGSQGRQYQIGRELAQALYQPGQIPVVGSGETYNLPGAALVMSHGANSFDIDDGHNMVKGHPGSSFVGGILAAGLAEDISYREYLTTLVIAYDIAVRMGLAMQDHYHYFHSTGAYGAVGTCAGMGRILGFDRELLNRALSIAEFHAPMVPVMRAVEYPSMNKDGVPFGSLVGVQAVLEAKAGYTGKTHLLEMPAYRHLVASLGKEYEIMNLYFKPYTCCRWAHPAIQAALSLTDAYQLDVSRIVRVEVMTFEAAIRLSKIVPQTTDEAQYNICYPLAVAIIDGDVGLLQVNDAYLNRPEVSALMDKITYVLDQELEDQFPQKRLCRVRIKMADGITYTSGVFAPNGEKSDQVDSGWMWQKFTRMTDPLLSFNQKKLIFSTLTNPNNDCSLREIVNTVNQARTEQAEFTL